MSEVESTAGSLTPRQALFVQEYLVDRNATRAAIRAGYSEATAYSIGHENLSKPDIAAAIDKAAGERSIRTQITADYVLGVIHETVERCRQVHPVLDREGKQVFVTTPNGEVVPAFTFDSKAVLKGGELLARHLGMLKDKIEHSGGIETRNREMTDEQLAAAIAAKQAELERHAGG